MSHNRSRYKDRWTRDDFMSRCSFLTRMASRTVGELSVWYIYFFFLYFSTFGYSPVPTWWYTHQLIISEPWKLPASCGLKIENPRDGRALRSVTRVALSGGSTTVSGYVWMCYLHLLFTPIDTNLCATTQICYEENSNPKREDCGSIRIVAHLMMVILSEKYIRLDYLRLDYLRTMVDQNGREPQLGTPDLN